MADGFQTIQDRDAGKMIHRRFSVAELDAMFEAQILSRDERIELVDGEIFQMNSQMMPHGVIKFNLAVKLVNLLPTSFRVTTESTVQLAESTLVDPDIFVTVRKPLERRYFRGDELLLAIEVSDTSLGYDLGKKASLYALAGVPELWVIDINEAQTWVHREPSSEGYASIVKVPFVGALASTAVVGVSVVISELLT